MQSSPLRNFEQNLISLISNSFKLLKTFCFSSAKKRQSFGDLRRADDCIKIWRREEMIMKAECHDTVVSNCLELCPIMSLQLLACLQACVYRVYSEGKKISPILFTGQSRCSHIVSRHKLYWFVHFACLIPSASVFVRKQKHKIWDILTKSRCLLATVILSDSNPHLSAEKDDVSLCRKNDFRLWQIFSVTFDPGFCVSRLNSFMFVQRGSDIPERS